MAKLEEIEGIGPVYAEKLRGAGIRSVEELSQQNPADLLAALGTTNQSKKLVRRLPTGSQVENWIEQATNLTYPLAKYSKFAIDTGIPDLAERHHRHIGRTLTVMYDGEVLRPQEPIELKSNKSYRVTIEEDIEQPQTDEMPEVFRRILDRARDLGVGDLAEQHDHYLYGTPKR